MKISLLTACGLLMASTFVAAQDEVIYFDATEPKLMNNEAIVMDGVRVEGFGLSAESDAVRLEYRFDPETLNFVLDTDNLMIYDEIGMFYENYMAIDVENIAPPFVANGEIYVQTTETTYEFTATESNPFIAEFVLAPGHVMGWYMTRVRRDYRYEFTGPNMSVSGEGVRGVNRVFDPVKIMEPGTYRLEIKPVDPEDQRLAFNISTYNNNSRQLLTLNDGDKLDDPMGRNTRDYSKYLVTIPSEATLRLAAPKRDSARIVMVNRQGQFVHEVIGQEEFLYTETARRPQTYYVFIEGGARYRSNVEIRLPEEEGTEQPTPTPRPQPEPEPEPEPEQPVTENPDEPVVDENPDEPVADGNADEPIFDDEPAELEELGTGV